MFDRTISLYSAGKTFSCTGWRIGYAVAPAALCAPLIASQGTISFELIIGNNSNGGMIITTKAVLLAPF